MDAKRDSESERELAAYESFVFIGDLCPAGREMARKYVERLRLGLRLHGPWKDNDGLDWRKEAEEELLDALIYIERAKQLEGA